MVSNILQIFVVVAVVGWRLWPIVSDILEKVMMRGGHEDFAEICALKGRLAYDFYFSSSNPRTRRKFPTVWHIPTENVVQPTIDIINCYSDP
jgi:hypothetical protein